uniref:Uncharacterized protein n=1 Tax=Ananas comosus var. bracteatus TaxID=296719 RepID=A0A6V7NR67_ANACO|nr:unnamed protein product [Ananas comosus var. bracteatus]
MVRTGCKFKQTARLTGGSSSGAGADNGGGGGGERERERERGGDGEEGAVEGPAQQGGRAGKEDTDADRVRGAGVPADPRARAQVRRADHRVAAPPGRALHHRRHRHRHHARLLLHLLLLLRLRLPPRPPPSASAPFILGKRLRSDADAADKEDAAAAAAASAAAAAVGVGVGIGPSGGFWALPARPDFGQIWSFAAAAAAAPEMVVPPASFSGRFAAAAAQPVGEASAARVGNYLPIAQGHLNLLATLSGAPAATSAGRNEDESR